MGTRNSVINGYSVNEDHPHAYGDKVMLSESTSPEQGSSPRVWGQVF